MEKSSIDGNNQASSFDCNICLDLVQDPIVTLCGHLYCSACIHRWLQSPTNICTKQQPQCPVCKSEISDKVLVPLYGRGQSSQNSKSRQPHYSPSHSSIEPIIGTLEGILFGRLFGRSVVNADAYPRSYSHLEGVSPRVRRQLMQANQTLSRICFFLLCCCVVCLLLF